MILFRLEEVVAGIEGAETGTEKEIDGEPVEIGEEDHLVEKDDVDISVNRQLIFILHKRKQKKIEFLIIIMTLFHSELI